MFFQVFIFIFYLTKSHNIFCFLTGFLAIFGQIVCLTAKKKKKKETLTLSLPESFTETFEMVLSFECVDKILWCDYSNETSLAAVLSHGTIYIELP